MTTDVQTAAAVGPSPERLAELRALADPNRAAPIGALWNAIEELADAVERLGWQPIQTAPINGTTFIAWGTIHNGPEEEETRGWLRVKRHSGRWHVMQPTGRYFAGFTPTHWRPMIAAPKE